MKKLAIDMGSTTTRIYELGSGLVLSEPSQIAISKTGGKNECYVGNEAKRLVGKTNDDYEIFSPISEGLVVDEDSAILMLDGFLKKIMPKSLFKQRFSSVFTLPCGVDLDERNKFMKIALANNSKNVEFIYTPIAAALSSNIPLNMYTPCFIVDMGGGLTNIAVVSLSGVIDGVSVSVSGNNLDNSLMKFIEDKHNLKIGSLSAERTKIQIASLYKNDMTSAVVSGRDLTEGKPRSIAISSDEIYELTSAFIDKLIEVIELVFSSLSAEVSAEIRETGIFLCGGMSNLPGIEDYLSKKLKLDVKLMDDSDNSVVFGLGHAMGSKELLEQIKIK